MIRLRLNHPSQRQSDVRNGCSFNRRSFIHARSFDVRSLDDRSETLYLQFSGARFAFVARKLDLATGRNRSAQFRRFQQGFPPTVYKINVELVSSRHVDLPYAK